MPAKRTDPRDATGAKSAKLQKEHAAELQRRENEISLINQAEQARSDEVIDMTGRAPLGATRQPGQPGVSVDVSGMLTHADEAYPHKTNDTGNAAVAPPTVTAVAADTGGTLAASTAYSYKVTSVTAHGESLPSAAASDTTPSGAADNSVALSWSAVSGATGGYNVYGRVSGSWGLLGHVSSPGFTDDGSGTPGAAPHATDTSGALDVGTETPSAVPGGTIADQRIRPTVDTRNATNVGSAGGPDPEAPRVFTLAHDEEGVVDVPGQPVHGLTVEEHDVHTVERRPSKVIRLNTTLEQVTIGQGTEYNFVEGQQYRVPAHVADYLEELGYVYH